VEEIVKNLEFPKEV